MLRPLRSAVGALRESVDEIILLIGAGNVPHLPFAIGINDVGFVDASVLPILFGAEHRRGLFDPPSAIPLQISDSVRTPDLLGTSRVVDAFDPGLTIGIPSANVGRAVSAAFTIPRVADS